MPTAPRSDHRGFRPVEVGRSHEYVAEQIRRQIMLRLIPPNGSLPPERELARMLGVGRATLQEAIRLLEEEGLLTTRRGRSGGTFVLGPTGGEAVAALVPKLRREAQLIEEALDYRLAIEPPAAALAARSDDAEDRAALRRAHEEGLIEEGNAEILAKDTDFHLIIGRMSQNHFLAEGIVAARLTLGDALFALPESQRWGARSSHEHDAILAAIEGGDESGAEAAMREHVRNTDAAIRALLRAL